MSLAIGLLMILTGLAIMAFGLFMFYAWLPLLYALIGFDVGLLLGRAFTGDVGTTAIVLGIAGALFLVPRLMFLSPIGAFCSVFPAASCSAFLWPPLSGSMAGLAASSAECWR